MRAIVFGGAGFIGSHLVTRLADEGFEIVVADIEKPESLPDGASYEYCDVRHPIAVTRDTPFDRAYNLAAVHRTPGHEPFEYFQTNVSGAQNVVDWCQDGGERVLIFTSSISVYGPTEQPKDETSQPAPNSDYGRSKLLAEQIHRRWQRSSSANRLIIARPAVVFGPGEKGNFTRLADALSSRRFMYAGRTDVIKSCGWVGDLVAAFEFAEGLARNEITFNFCYRERLSIEQICHAFHDVAGFALPRMLPKPALAAAIAVLGIVNPNDRGTLSGARVAKLTASNNIVPQKLIDEGFQWPTDLTTGLVAWRDASPVGSFV